MEGGGASLALNSVDPAVPTPLSRLLPRSWTAQDETGLRPHPWLARREYALCYWCRRRSSSHHHQQSSPLHTVACGACSPGECREAGPARCIWFLCVKSVMVVVAVLAGSLCAAMAQAVHLPSWRLVLPPVPSACLVRAVRFRNCHWSRYFRRHCPSDRLHPSEYATILNNAPRVCSRDSMVTPIRYPEFRVPRCDIWKRSH